MAKKKVLVVDDEQGFIELIRDRLEAKGFDVITAINGREALEMAHTEEPDLMILDVMMPEMNGYDVCRKIKIDKKFSDMPIIILTAKFQPNDIEFGKEMGADAYLTKPLELETLSDKMDELLKVDKKPLKRRLNMKKLGVFIVGIAVFFAGHAFAMDISDIMPSLKGAKKTIDATLTEIDVDVTAAAKALSGIDLKGDAARKILNNLRKFRPYVVNCSIIDPDGVKITVEPPEYKQYEGADRSDLPYVVSLLKHKKPAMSDVYLSSENIPAITIGYPIVSDMGEILGAVRMLIRYGDFLKPLVDNEPCKVWMMQINGLIVYDADSEEIGKNIFSDPMFSPFPDLISFAKTVVSSNSGAGSYNFYADAPTNKKLVEKIAAWDTAGLYGTQWRVIAMEISDTPPDQAVIEPAAAAPASAEPAPAR